MSENKICSFPDCDKKYRAKGLCSGHWNQAAQGKQLTPIGSTRHVPLRGSKSASLEEFFWSRVDISDDCWTWTGAKVIGYGRVKYQGLVMYAHRYSYELHAGPIPEGAVIDHMCHNRGCVNPEHLRAASHKQNMENRSGPHSNSVSGVRGVFWSKANRKWRALVIHNGKRIHMGYFDNLEDAGKAAKEGRARIFSVSN